MKTIISTVGTSIFENFFQLPENSSHKAASNYSHLKKNNYAYAEWDSHKTRIEALEKINWEKDKVSAEIASIIAIQKELDKDIKVHLLATDTILSVLAAELIKQWFEEESNKEVYPGVKEVTFVKPAPEFENNETENHVVKDLRIDSQHNYEKGMMALLEVLNHITTKDTVLNITGGYKAIVPMLTVWAQIKKVTLKYLFNESELLNGVKPLTLHDLPVHFDYSVMEDNYIAFEAIKPSKKVENLPNTEEFRNELSKGEDFKRLQDLFIIQTKTDRISLTPFGITLYQHYEASHKEEGFSPSNLLGKVMEIKVFEYFKKCCPDALTELGKPIGQSSQGHAYDLDVYVETNEDIYAIEVKPENVSLLYRNGKVEKETIEYKCKEGAFKCALNEQKDKTLMLCLFMYHHQEPNKHQVGNMKALMEMENNPCKANLHWFWVKPKPNYKGNVNWNIQESDIKKFNFAIQQWEVWTKKGQSYLPR